jgi:hypothetical protein
LCACEWWEIVRWETGLALSVHHLHPCCAMFICVFGCFCR